MGSHGKFQDFATKFLDEFGRFEGALHVCQTLPVAAKAEKLPQNRVLRGLEMFRLSQNQMNLGNYESRNTLTQIDATYAFSK